MTIKGVLTDSATGKSISGATFNVYYSGSTAGPPNGSFMSGADGSYTYVDASLDTAGSPAISVTAPGYDQALGDPAFFNGPNTLDPEQITVTKIPAWVWIAVAVAAIFAFIYFNKKYKLIK